VIADFGSSFFSVRNSTIALRNQQRWMIRIMTSGKKTLQIIGTLEMLPLKNRYYHTSLKIVKIVGENSNICPVRRQWMSAPGLGALTNFNCRL
jgi:hypothetical protein